VVHVPKPARLHYRWVILAVTSLTVLMFITGVGGITALAHSGIGHLLASAEGQRLLTASCAEVDAVARAEGIQLSPDAVHRTLKQAGSLAPQWQSSMARDLEVGAASKS
jgi:ketopantoate reductase